MATSIIELVVIVLKLLYSIVSSIMAWKEEERNRFEERMKTLTFLLKDAIVNKEESLNEKDFLSNLEWEKQERYKAYKQAAIEVLSVGGGINELKTKTVMGMHLRITDKLNDVVAILVKDITVEDKSKLIAKLLSEV